MAPRAIAWFGFSSFWGHLRHLLASAIATDSVDSRQWMVPEAPGDLLGRIAAVLAPRGARDGATLAASMGGEIWIDFIADTGDDATVSEAVARLIAADYAVGSETLPRGSILIHGGDLAYPVATVREMSRRLITPFNRVFEPLCDWSKPRVLLSIPGNHDWYDGLDGFARLCQAPCTFEDPLEIDDLLHPRPNESPVLAWAQAFASGKQVQKPGAMAIAGYVPVQQSSYFRLPLARGIDLFGVDRQLRDVDRRQRAYFTSAKGAARLVILPDPARAWGESRPTGTEALAAIDVVPARDPTLVLSGDIHHYERSREGPSVHVVAGGGGAFIHGARVTERGAHYPRDVEFPGPARVVGDVSSPAVAPRDRAGRLGDHVHLRPRGLAGAPLVPPEPRRGRVDRSHVEPRVRDRHRAAHRQPPSHGPGRGLRRRVRAGDRRASGGARRRRQARRLLGARRDAARPPCGHLDLRARVDARQRCGLRRHARDHRAPGAQPLAALRGPRRAGLQALRAHARAGARLGLASVEAFVVGVVDPVGGSPPVLVDHFTWTPGGPETPG